MGCAGWDSSGWLPLWLLWWPGCGHASAQCGQSRLAVVLVYLILSLSLSLSPPLHPTPLPRWLPAHRQTAPYGLGNPPRRRRRSLPRRCECCSAKDPACATFCHRRPWYVGTQPAPARGGCCLDLSWKAGCPGGQPRRGVTQWDRAGSNPQAALGCQAVSLPAGTQSPPGSPPRCCGGASERIYDILIPGQEGLSTGDSGGSAGPERGPDAACQATRLVTWRAGLWVQSQGSGDARAFSVEKSHLRLGGRSTVPELSWSCWGLCPASSLSEPQLSHP